MEFLEILEVIGLFLAVCTIIFSLIVASHLQDEIRLIRREHGKANFIQAMRILNGFQPCSCKSVWGANARCEKCFGTGWMR